MVWWQWNSTCLASRAPCIELPINLLTNLIEFNSILLTIDLSWYKLAYKAITMVRTNDPTVHSRINGRFRRTLLSLTQSELRSRGDGIIKINFVQLCRAGVPCLERMARLNKRSDLNLIGWRSDESRLPRVLEHNWQEAINYRRQIGEICWRFGDLDSSSLSGSQSSKCITDSTAERLECNIFRKEPNPRPLKIYQANETCTSFDQKHFRDGKMWAWDGNVSM